MILTDSKRRLLEISLLYLVPLLSISALSSYIFSPNRSFTLFLIGIVLTAIGTLILYKDSSKIETEPQKLEDVEPETAFDRDSLGTLEARIEEQNREIGELKEERIKHLTKIDGLMQDAELIKGVSSDEVEQQKKHLQEFEETIAEQRAIINRKQQQISEFESKVHDLNYEVKTLLKLANFNAEPEPDASPKELPSKSIPTGGSTVQDELKRCIDIAQKMTGQSPFGGGGLRFRELNIDSWALDLRRLCDALRSETIHPIVIWSQRENKLLFANHEIKGLLGWNAEQFVQEFRQIVQPSLHAWQDGMSELQTHRETSLSLSMRAKGGHTVPLRCQFKTIPAGIFRSHAIGILYS